MFDKEIIKDRFSSASASYNSYAGLQKVVAMELARRVPTLCPTSETLLDIGAGTGFLSSEIKKKEPSISVTTLDIAHGMSITLKSSNEEYYVVTGDVEFLPFPCEVFTTVVSSLSMQWVPELGAAVNEVFRVLKGRGRVLIAILGAGSFPELKESHDRFFDKTVYKTLFHNLPRLGEVRDILKTQNLGGVSVSRSLIEEEYKNSLLFLNRLKYIGAQNPFRRSEHKREYGKMKKMLSWYDSRFSTGKGVRASYEILWIEGKK